MPTVTELLCGLVQSDADTQDLSGDTDITLLPIEIVVLAMLLGVVLALFVRSRYRRGVRRLMRFDVSQEIVASADDRVDAIDEGDRGEVGRGGGANLDLAAVAQARAGQLTRGTITAVAVFACGAPVVSGLLGAGPGAALLATVGSALFASGPAMVNLRPDGSRRALLTAGAAALAGTVIAESIVEGWSWLRDGAEVFGVLLFALMFYVTTLHRTLRPLVAPLTVFAAPLSLSLFLPPAYATLAAGCEPVPLSPDLLALAAGLMVILVLLALVALLMMSFRLVDLLADWQQRGIFSDVALISGFGLFLIAVIFTSGLELAGTGRTTWRCLVAAGGWTAGACAAYAVAVSRRKLTHPGSSLLVLRVFDQTGHAGRLLDGIQTRWRTIGPIWQIGGPDLAQMNVDLFETTLYLAGRLHELFSIAAWSVSDLSRRLHRPPSPDGRWHVEEVFCFNNRWRGTVERLMLMSDVILVDVRGFVPARAGTAYELSLLEKLGLLPKSLAVGDERTDWAGVDALVKGKGPDSPEVRRIALTTASNSEQCFQELAKIASRSQGSTDRS